MQILAVAITAEVIMPKHKQNTKNFNYRIVALFNSAFYPERTWPRYTLKAAHETLVRIEKNALFVSARVERLVDGQWVEVQD
jgi:hypothetical protein